LVGNLHTNRQVKGRQQAPYWPGSPVNKDLLTIVIVAVQKNFIKKCLFAPFCALSSPNVPKWEIIFSGCFNLASWFTTMLAGSSKPVIN
jgi:hypothetical protein